MLIPFIFRNIQKLSTVQAQSSMYSRSIKRSKVLGNILDIVRFLIFLIWLTLLPSLQSLHSPSSQSSDSFLLHPSSQTVLAIKAGF
jgi:hypothetical protein